MGGLIILVVQIRILRNTLYSARPSETETYRGTLDDSARAIVRQLGKPPMGKGV
ncbi:MAG: hypothetical protein ACO2O5_06545 [Candidatus Caldipriscus sp.]